MPFVFLETDAETDDYVAISKLFTMEKYRGFTLYTVLGESKNPEKKYAEMLEFQLRLNFSNNDIFSRIFVSVGQASDKDYIYRQNSEIDSLFAEPHNSDSAFHELLHSDEICVDYYGFKPPRELMALMLDGHDMSKLKSIHAHVYGSFNYRTMIGQNPQRISDIGQNPQRISDIGQNPQRISDIGQNPQRISDIGQNPQRISDIDSNTIKHFMNLWSRFDYYDSFTVIGSENSVDYLRPLQSNIALQRHTSDITKAQKMISDICIRWNKSIVVNCAESVAEIDAIPEDQRTKKQIDKRNRNQKVLDAIKNREETQFVFADPLVLCAPQPCDPVTLVSWESYPVWVQDCASSVFVHMDISDEAKTKRRDIAIIALDKIIYN